MINRLQDALETTLKELFKDKVYKTPPENKTSPGKRSLNFYKEYIPEGTYETEESEFPYMVTKIIDGSSQPASIGDKATIQTKITIGIFEDDGYLGCQDVLNAIQKILFHFREHPTMDAFEIESPIDWLVLEEDYYPLFFGGVIINWSYRQAELQRNEYI